MGSLDDESSSLVFSTSVKQWLAWKQAAKKHYYWEHLPDAAQAAIQHLHK